MTLRTTIVGVALAIIGVPLVFVLVFSAWVALQNKTNGAFVSSGQKREYLLYVPSSYDGSKPTPLVISLHGAGGWPAQEAHASRWNQLADRTGFIVVYPSGTLEGPRIWHVERGAGLARDVRFISELIDTIETHYHIDPARIYANGLSNGGGMSFVLACRLYDRIAAVGLVSSAQTLPWNWCTEHRPMPMMAFHGTADPFVPYGGGLPDNFLAPTNFDPNARPFPNIMDWTTNWARRNQCEAVPVDSTIGADVSRRAYTHCAGDAAVVLYTVRGMGHQWPGGKPMPTWFAGPGSAAIDATSVLWEFFRAHPRPAS